MSKVDCNLPFSPEYEALLAEAYTPAIAEVLANNWKRAPISSDAAESVP